MKTTPPKRRRFPWAWLFALLTLASAYVFFGLPHQLKDSPMRIEFAEPQP